MCISLTSAIPKPPDGEGRERGEGGVEGREGAVDGPGSPGLTQPQGLKEKKYIQLLTIPSVTPITRALRNNQWELF